MPQPITSEINPSIPAMDADGRLIGVDWGTTNCRIYLIDRRGRVLERIENSRGILSVDPGGFADVLRTAVAELGVAGTAPKILLSGMVGSRQGWHEAPYLACPAALSDLAQHLERHEAEGIGTVHFVPGLRYTDRDGVPDVMRGEETQIFGAMAALGLSDGRIVLPGTHSKWVRVENGRVVSFATYMTGEIYALLRNHSILGRLMTEPAGKGEGFLRGVKISEKFSRGGDLLHALFSVRTNGLFDVLPAGELGDYLSGMLIGAELRAATIHGDAAPIHILANAELAERYRAAAAVIGLETLIIPPESIAQGYAALARSADLEACS